MKTQIQLVTICLVLGLAASFAQAEGTRGIKKVHGMTLEGEQKQLNQENPVKLQAAMLCQRKAGDAYQDIEQCDGAELREGDRFKLSMQVDKNSYVYIFIQNSQGQFQMAFPDKGQDNKIKAGKRYFFPSATEGWAEMDNTSGTTDVVSVIVSPYVIKELEEKRGLDISGKPAEQEGKAVEAVVTECVATRGIKIAKVSLAVEEEATAAPKAQESAVQAASVQNVQVKTTEFTAVNNDIAAMKFNLVRP